MHAMKAYLPPLARLLMSSLFIWDGILALRDPSGTAKYFASVHVPIPDVAVWISIVFHLLAGLGILVGFKIRWAAAALVVFCLGTGFGVHTAPVLVQLSVLPSLPGRVAGAGAVGALFFPARSAVALRGSPLAIPLRRVGRGP